MSPKRYRATGRIRRNGLRRVPGQSREADGSGGPGRRADAPRRRGAPAGRWGRTHGCRRARHGAGHRLLLRGTLAATELGKALDALLPPDVAVRDLRPAPDGFNPRFAARYREYRYTVWNGPRSPLRERTALGVRVPLDTAAMARAGSAFIGRHDFRAFGATDRSPVRTVMAVRVRRDGRLVTIDVRADSFLRGQVRRMVASSWRSGSGRWIHRGPVGTCRSRSRPSRGQRPRRRACASGASPSGDRPGAKRTENTRNDEREDLYGPGERDRATLVRRGRDGRDARPPRLAHRARPRRQAQADLPAQPRLGRSRDRAQRRRGSPSPATSSRARSTPATAATRRASRKRPSVTCLAADRRRSSAAP